MTKIYLLCRLYSSASLRLQVKVFILTFIFYFSFSSFRTEAQGVSVNDNGAASSPSAILDVSSTTQGQLFPRMTTAQRNMIIGADGIAGHPPVTGLVIYNTTTNCMEIYIGGFWQNVVCGCDSAAGAAGAISGTATVCPGQNAVLYTVPAIAGAADYLWAYSGTGASIVGSGNAVIIYFSGSATSGDLTVTGTNACGNGTVSGNYAITVNSTAPSITAQPASAATCLGTGAVAYTVTATGGYTYQWQEFIVSWNNIANAGVYSNVSTATLTITNPPSGMNGNKYRCVVSGTCTNTTSDGLASLTVHPIPAVTNTSTATICSGTGPNISLTATVASNFAWTVGAVTGGITGATAGSGASINQTLTNPNTTAGTVEYIITPTSTVGSCIGAAFTITVTVNPTPAVTNSSLSQTICSGGNSAMVTLTSNVSGTTFAWTSSATTGISGHTASGTSTIPVQSISTTALTAGTVTYSIIPSASGCAGNPTSYVITITPKPTTVTATASPNPVCPGSVLTLTGSAVNGTVWNWSGPNSFSSTAQSPAISGITAAAAGVYTLITGNGSCAGAPVLTSSVTVTVFSATGGTITYTDASGLNPRSSPPYAGGYTVHTFTSSGVFTPNCTGYVSYLVVGGGAGGGGNGGTTRGGGGGAGGMLTGSSFAVSAVPITVTVGTGGAVSTSGTNSVFSTITAFGGGFGANYGPAQNGGTGGSGGGGGVEATGQGFGGAGTAGQGNAGGNSTIGYGIGGWVAGGGGGGAGAVGANATGTNVSNTNHIPGKGGDGVASSISGNSTYYAGGGGGGGINSSGINIFASGGLGGGGSNSNGVANTGGGGSAGSYSGGSGIVIIRYPN